MNEDINSSSDRFVSSCSTSFGLQTELETGLIRFRDFVKFHQMTIYMLGFERVLVTTHPLPPATSCLWHLALSSLVHTFQKILVSTEVFFSRLDSFSYFDVACSESEKEFLPKKIVEIFFRSVQWQAKVFFIVDQLFLPMHLIVLLTWHSSWNLVHSRSKSCSLCVTTECYQQTKLLECVGRIHGSKNILTKGCHELAKTTRAWLEMATAQQAFGRSGRKNFSPKHILMRESYF